MHVPFCTRRCSYCDFATAVFEEDVAEAYVAALGRELRQIPAPVPFSTVYLGGGTPTALRPVQLERLLSLIRERCSGPVPEFTCEANPESLDAARLSLLLAAGVNRVSLGNQSFQPAVLAALGRLHAPHETFRALDLLRAAGLENVNVDLMFGAPGETVAELEADLDQLLALDLPHVSAYCLSFEDGTPLTRNLRAGRVRRTPPGAELRQYRRVRDRLEQAGLPQYEVSNYARPGRESRHNQVYWAGLPYHGVGLGAGSYLQGVRRTNTRSMREYLSDWEEPCRPPHEAECLEPRARARERLVLGLRTRRGVHETGFAAATGHDLRHLYPSGVLDRLQELGLLRREEGFVRLSERGLELSDSIFVELV